MGLGWSANSCAAEFLSSRYNSCTQDAIFKIRAEIILQNEIPWNCGILAFKVQYT